MAKIVSKRERDRIKKELEQRVEEARKQLADGQDLIDRLTRDIEQLEDDAWIEHMMDRNSQDAGIVDINYIQTEDC